MKALSTMVMMAQLGAIEANGCVVIDGTRSVHELRRWLMGYELALCATLIGIRRHARSTVVKMEELLRAQLRLEVYNGDLVAA